MIDLEIVFATEQVPNVNTSKIRIKFTSYEFLNSAFVFLRYWRRGVIKVGLTSIPLWLRNVLFIPERNRSEKFFTFLNRHDKIVLSRGTKKQRRLGYN